MKAVAVAVAVAGVAAVVLVGVLALGGQSQDAGPSAGAPAAAGCPGQSVGGGGGDPGQWAAVPSGSVVPPAVQGLRRPNAAAATTPPVVLAPTQPSNLPQPGISIGASVCDASYSGAAAGSRPGGTTASWDPGNIISDQVFYDTAAVSVQQIRQFIATKNVSCATGNPWCAKNLQISWPAYPADGDCQAIAAGAGADAATAIDTFSVACGINPQVMLVTWQKESQGLERSNPTEANYAAAWGWNCPDTGPGGSANCASSAAGFVNQLHGMASQWARYRKRIPAGYYPYQVGKTVTILWNVEESGCGGGPVTIRNVATASLYVYTPYQPNAAALAAYPGEGDRCSAYGNRNFFRMFQSYFGDTGGGLATGVAAPAGYQQGAPQAGGVGTVPVTYAGNTVTIPSVDAVPADMRGQQIVAPTPKVAAAIAAGLTWLGTPYSWGGGGAGGPSKGICDTVSSSGCTTVGFDCSGLTRYVAARWGASIPQVSSDQRNPAVGIPWSQAQPGDLQGHPGHITIYIGTFNGVRMRLEAPYTGAVVRISPVDAGTDNMVYRYWNTQ